MNDPGQGQEARPVWRLLDHPPSAGSWNMAVDDALLEACAAGGPGFPCVRFYSWDPPALSLGYHQALDAAADAAVLRELGVGLVRRPTGGRAVLHENEVTYSVVASSRRGAMAGPVMASYRRISEALAGGLGRLGVGAALSRGDAPAPRTSVEPCFARRSRCEVEAQGVKLVGSVQLQRRGALLQHGSIPLRLDRERLARATRGGRSRSGRALEDLAGRAVSRAELVRHLVLAFEHSFAVRLAPGELTPAETVRCRQLETERYRHADWTRLAPPGRRAQRST